MCKFCKVDENGDIASKSLVFGEVKHFIKSKLNNESDGVKVNAEIKFPFHYDVMVSGNEGLLSLLLYTWDEKLNFQKDIKINYCPMCGRKL